MHLAHISATEPRRNGPSQREFHPYGRYALGDGSLRSLRRPVPSPEPKEAIMTQKLYLGVALSALLVSGALAQQPSPGPQPSANPPAAAQDKTSPPPAAAQDKASPTPAAAENKSGAKAEFVMSQKPDQWLASKFKGTDVLGSDNKKIGDVSDILFDKSGKIEAFVVSVGGFLGMGAKEVALAPSAFEVVPGDKGGSDKLKVALTTDELKQAQNFARYSPPRPASTTGSAPMKSPARPAGPTGR
jgi:sporulation protein YlmC with PRC-barrel domain